MSISQDVDYEKFGGTIADLPSISGNRNDDLLCDKDMITAFGLSKTIRFLAVIDAIFTFSYALYYWPILFAGILPICGYIGAKKYKFFLVSLYVIFNILNISARCYTIYYGYNIKRTDDIVISSLGLVINVWVLWMIIKFLKIISKLSSLSLNELSNGWKPYHRVWILV